MTETSKIDLTKELFLATPENRRCEHLRRDRIGAYCAKDLKEGAEINMGRRYVCDTLSLQLWCLDKERCNKCIFYNGEPFEAY